MLEQKTIRALEPLTMPGEYRSLVDRWRAVARHSPDRVAISSDGASYTFAEADALSDRIARRLRATLFDDGFPVGALLTQTADSVLGILGLMKADRILVILDPHLPAERLLEIARLAGMSTCIADTPSSALGAQLGDPVKKVIALDDLLEDRPVDAAGTSAAADDAADLPAPTRGGADAFAVVFTSGSTGRPKGVVLTHDVVLNDAYGHSLRYSLGEEQECAIVLPFSFAAGLSLLFIVQLNGAGMRCFDPRDSGTRGLIDLIRRERLTTLHCTPHLVRSISAAMSSDQVLDSLRVVATVGEAIHGRDVEAIRAHLSSGATYFNWTGSSEMGALSLHEIPAGTPVPEGPVAAGRVLVNKEVRLVDENGQAVADGEQGEILVVSDYLSGGYWNDEAQTALRYGYDADGRRYCRQGDLAKFDTNGDLVLLGRADAAVKVRGYLVEPGEVETALLRIEGVQEALVLPVIDPPKPTTLIAYVVPDPSVKTTSPAALRRLLRASLPEYMVPATIIPLAQMPRNERGKIDRVRLPSAASSAEHVPPGTEWERLVGGVWSEILGLEQVGLEDDFMAVGGDSLTVEEMLTVIDERFGVSLVSADLIGATTLREFTRRVKLGSASLPRHPDVVTLRADGDGDPLFCFAGAGALALTFLPLSRHISDRPIYVFQAHGLERRAWPDWSVEAAARRFLEIMRVVRPRGPYSLVGHSFGGLVALEIARLLEQAGETVSQVCLLDTYLPESTYAEARPDIDPVAQVSAPPPKKGARAAIASRLPAFVPQGLPQVGEWGRHVRARLAGVVPFSGQRQYDAFFDHAASTGRRYQLTPYAGRTLLVLAEGNPDGPAAWDRILTGSHDFVSIKSEHSSILREPHARLLAAVLQAELGRQTD